MPTYETQGPILPPFDVVPDAALAQALSEALQPDLCTYIPGPSCVDIENIPSITFPPEPAYFVCATTAYIDRQRRVRRLYAPIQPMSEQPPKTQTLKLYKDTIGVRQDPSASGTLESIAGLIIIREKPDFLFEAVRSAGLRLVATHLIARTQETRRLVDALVVSRPAAAELTLHLREHLLPLTRKLGLPEDERDANEVRSILNMSVEGHTTAANIMARFLPDVRVMRQALVSHDG